MSVRGTVRAFSARAARSAQKAALAAGCAVLRIELTDLADACDVNYSTAKAWASAQRDHALPDWAMRRIRLSYPALAAYLDAALADLGGEGPLQPESAEAGSKVFVGTLGGVLSAISAGLAGDERYDAREAAELLRVLLDARKQIDRLVPALQRIVEGARPAAGSA